MTVFISGADVIVVDNASHCPDGTMAVERFIVTTNCPSGYNSESVGDVKHYTSSNDPIANQDETGTYVYCAV
jgi:hypothetical protein